MTETLTKVAPAVGDLVHIDGLSHAFATDGGKALFRQHLVQHVPIVAHIKRVLDERPSRRAPILRFKDEFEDHMTEDNAEATLRAVISLARYGEVFAYDEHTVTFNLENPV